MKTVVLVGAAVIDKGKILLLKRVETDDFLPGYYDVPGGKLEEGEDPNKGVLRELKEETGMDGKVIRPYNVWHEVVDYHGGRKHIIEIDFLVEVRDKSRIKLSKDEHSEYIWVDRKGIPKKITPALKKTVMKAFECSR